MKRLFISIFVASTVLLAFAGCGNSNEEETATSEEATTEEITSEETTTEVVDEETVTIDYWYDYTGDGGAAMEEACAKYSEETGIQVNPLFVANDALEDKVITSTSAGDPPDVVAFDRFMTAQWAQQGLLTDLTPYIEELGIDMTQFYSFTVEESTYEGKIYSIPFYTDIRALYWNKDMYEAAGLDPEKGPTTIDELDAYAEACTIYDEDGRITQFGFIPWYADGRLYGWGIAFGGDFYDEETGTFTACSEEIIAALEWEYSYAEKYGAETIQSATDAGAQSGLDLFISEKLAMTVQTQTLMVRLEDANPDLNYGVTYIPTPTGSDYKTWCGGFCFIVPSGADNPLESLQFIEYLATGEGAVMYCEATGSLSASPEINEQLQWLNEYEYAQFFLDSFEIAQCRPPIPVGQLYWDELAKCTTNTIFGIGTAEENLAIVDENVNAALQEIE